jgi:hypothetical protein
MAVHRVMMVRVVGYMKRMLQQITIRIVFGVKSGTDNILLAPRYSDDMRSYLNSDVGRTNTGKNV